MKYALLCYDVSAKLSAQSGSENQELVQHAMNYYVQALQENGVLVSFVDLQVPEAAVTLEYRDNHRVVLDGPGLTAERQLSAFFLIDVPHLDDALDWAALFPRAPERVIELRPVFMS